MTTLQASQPVASTAIRTAGRASAATPFRPHVVGAVFARDFLGYFSSPAGYVFIVLFVAACSFATFCLPAFFANNIAGLDQLNGVLPYLLLFFIPAITMSVWAEERRQGTEELLLTLPARDIEIVLGKYLAAFGIYTAALGFLAFGHFVIFRMYPAVGRPDGGVLLATYLGYWLAGALLLAVGMVASAVASSATVAFILGAVFCALPVLPVTTGLLGAFASAIPGSARLLGATDPEAVRRIVGDLSVPAQLRDFTAGVVPFSGVFYFLSLAAVMLYVNMLLLHRRHWAGGTEGPGRWLHGLIRVAALVVALISLDVLVARAGIRPDLSAEGLNTLSPESRKLIAEIPADRPVFIQAYYSPEVPREYVETKADLLNLLREIASIGGDRVRLNLIETERFSDPARDAEKRFGITPRRVFSNDEAKQSSEEIYLGVAFTSGPEEVVVPFLDRGLSVEYELIRSIRVASRVKRKKVGVLATDARMLGGFDFSAMSMGQNNEWQVVTELKKQYEVSSVAADTPIPSDLDALIVAQPSSLTQPQIDNLTAYVRHGGATLMFLDPLPLVDPSLSPREPKTPPGGPFGGSPPPTPKGDLKPLLDLLGVNWPDTSIVWQPYNPHPQLPGLSPEFVFVATASGAADAFGDDRVSKGLQEVVLLFPGHFRESGATTKLTPLLRTNAAGGTLEWSETVERGLFGSPRLNEDRPYFATDRAYTLAARVGGKLAAEAPAADPSKKDQPKAEPREVQANVILVGDLDMISDQFFELRKKPTESVDFLDFDNVTFVLNCVDSLAGDDSFIALRKRRPKHRTLEAVERQSEIYIKKAQEDSKRAEDAAKKELESAQKRLDATVEKVRADKSLDERTKQIALANLQDVENRRLEVTKATIEDKKRGEIAESRAEKERAIAGIHSRIKAQALAIPPLPPLLLGIAVFLYRKSRENRGASPNRLA